MVIGIFPQHCLFNTLGTSAPQGIDEVVQISAGPATQSLNASAREDPRFHSALRDGSERNRASLKNTIFHPSWKARMLSGNGTVLLGGMLLIAGRVIRYAYNALMSSSVVW